MPTVSTAGVITLAPVAVANVPPVGPVGVIPPSPHAGSAATATSAAWKSGMSRWDMFPPPCNRKTTAAARTDAPVRAGGARRDPDRHALVTTHGAAAQH